MSTLNHPDEARTWECDACHFDFEGDKNEALKCSNDACDHDYLCIGCTFECAVCGNDYCRTCIVETPLADGRWSLYECRTCHDAASALVRKQPRRAARETAA